MPSQLASIISTPSPHKSPLPPLSTQILMAQQARWETFSDDDDDDNGNNSNNDDALSLSDLPIESPTEKQETERKPSEALEDFEFRACGDGLLLKPGPEEADMCVADDIFFKGQLLPLKSYSSQSDRSLSSNSTSSTSNCSSSSISRSQSSSSRSSNCDAPRLSISNKFYAHPSPRPQVRTNISSGRKSTGSAPPRWALFRLGVVKAPEIELNDLKLRRLRSNESKCEPKVKKSGPRFGLGFGCKCAPDVTEPVLIRKKKEDVVIGYEKRESICKSSRMFEWLEELSIGKGSALR